jgi:MGT family glycosyltransferase
MNDIKKISIVTPPFSGHLKILSKLARELRVKNKDTKITFIVTGWNDVKISKEDAESLHFQKIDIIELNKEKIKGSQPMTFTFPRVVDLTDKVIEACKESDYVIYDFFSLEGYIAAKRLNLPAVCSIPAIMGPFNPDCKMLHEGIQKNINDIKKLENKYYLDIANQLEMVSDGFFITSDYHNVQWSWKKFITEKSYKEHRSVQDYFFIRPDVIQNETTPLIEKLLEIKKHKKIIYLSLGTVVTGNLWNNVKETREFIKKIFKEVTDRFSHDNNVEVVVATGRKISDLFTEIPKNFHVYEQVPQTSILKLADVFVTHAGGNSVNEAIDAEIPMVAIPFFGDQHVCSDNIAKQGIGISLLADAKYNDSIVDTESCHLERTSMNQNGLVKAIDAVLCDQKYKNKFTQLKSDKPFSISNFLSLLENDKILNWQEGDLLYGCNEDRKRIAALTGRSNFYRLCDMRPFSLLFGDLNNRDSMPRIIDQYHDILIDNKIFSDEKNKTYFTAHKQMLCEYQQKIRHHLDKLPLLKNNKQKHDEVIWDMCIEGLDFFIKKQKTIHFVFESFNEQINLATRRELSWIKQHWSNDTVKKYVKFYLIQNNHLIETFPEKFDWFKQRPTPTLFDRCPTKVDPIKWTQLMQDVRNARRNLFFNHLPEKFPLELDALKRSGLAIINTHTMPMQAKQSLSTGEVHIYSIDENGIATILPKQTKGIPMSHAIVANNDKAICLGEVRLRSICVNGKWLKVIDLSNDSGHYRPDAKGLDKAIKAFEKMGYIVYRVNAIHTKVPESFNKVEEKSLTVNLNQAKMCL